jgi:hypothetical protein
MEPELEALLSEAEVAAKESLDLIQAKGSQSGFDPLTTSAGKSALALVALARAVRLLEQRLAEVGL